VSHAPISLAQKFETFREPWSPKVIARMNDYEFKLARLDGEFVWHSHPETDETFLVIEGELVIELRDGDVRLTAGELFVVPRGVEHKPRASSECKVMLIEPAGTVNTGDAGGDLTAPNGVWI
jgi:mannose-6-phosphate isomerase-like protein (cupin superfamily)